MLPLLFWYKLSLKIICPVEVKTFDDGSVWFKLDATIACLAVGVDGKPYIR